MPQSRPTLEPFCCSQSSRSLLPTSATSALGCLPLLNCSTPTIAIAKGGPAMSDSSSSRSRMMPPCTAPAKESVTWKFSAGTQRASGTPDCSVTSSWAISSGTGRAMNSRGIGVQVLGHEGQQAVGDDLGASYVGVKSVGLVERGILRNAVENEGIERQLILVRQPLVETVKGRDIFSSEVARRHHACEPHRVTGRLQFFDERRKV